MVRFVCRFGVGDPDGQRSSVWRVWSARKTSDLYIVAKMFGGDHKISFHEAQPDSGFREARRHAGVTQEYVAKKMADHDWQGGSRHWDVWTTDKPTSHPDINILYRMRFPASHLGAWPLAESEKKQDTFWIPVPDIGHAVEVVLLKGKREAIEAGDWPGKTSPGTTLIADGILGNGEMVWLVYCKIEEGQFDNIDNLRNEMKKLRDERRLDPHPGVRVVAHSTESDGSRAVCELAYDALLGDV